MITRFEATFVYRRMVADAFNKYRETGRRACRVAGRGFALSKACSSSMHVAWTDLIAELAIASRFLNKYPVVAS